jgi:NADH dehydrogenase
VKAPTIVIVGGGFGGLYTAKSLKKAPARVTLIDRCNFHLFQPLLYQVATVALSPGEIASPLRFVLGRQQNTNVLLAEVIDIDTEARRLKLRDGEVDYDFLVLATGSHHHYFGNDQWEELAPGLKTIEDATEIRHRILLAFENAERETDPEKQRAWLTFVIVGGGPTGVELAGALAEIARDTLRHDFRRINPAEARILLVESSGRLLTTFPPDLSKRAEKDLLDLGVRSLAGVFVTGVDREGVTTRSGDRTEHIAARTVLWAAGVQGSPLGRLVAQRTGAPVDRAGRVVVEPDLSVPGHPEIFVIGDLANFSHQTGQPLPGVAPVAMAEGRYVARLIKERLRGKTTAPFHYRDKGNLATIGRNKAVADFGRLHLAGFPAWFAWVFIHLMYLVEFDNRLLVLMEKFTFWTADVVISTNESYKRVAMERGGKKENEVFVVRNGPDLDRLGQLTPNEQLRKDFRYLIGYVGVISQQEGIDNLLRIADYIVHKKNQKDIKFIIIGTGPYWREMVDLSEKMGLKNNVWFTGFIPDSQLYEILSTVDVCVNPEFGNEFTDKSTMIKIMEYMTFGKPIVQFYTTEGAVSAGESALYIKNNSEQEFADALMELLEDGPRRKRMGAEGRRRIHESLCWQKQRGNLELAYGHAFTKGVS